MISFITFSQTEEPQELVIIETKVGNEFVGVVLDEDDDKLVLKTEVFGVLTIRKKLIARRRIIDSSQMVVGKSWDDNPQSTRYLLTPNGYGLKKGEGYYQNIWVLVNQFSYGFSNRFSISAGIIPIFFFGDAFGPVWVIPKFSIPIKEDDINMSAVAFIGTVAGESGGGAGFVFSNLTLGNRNRNWNFGIGWGYIAGEWAKRPVINISRMHRVSARSYLLTENYYLPSGYDSEFGVILSGGYRYMAKKVGIDFGLYVSYTPRDRDYWSNWGGIPILGVTFPF